MANDTMRTSLNQARDERFCRINGNKLIVEYVVWTSAPRLSVADSVTLAVLMLARSNAREPSVAPVPQ